MLVATGLVGLALFVGYDRIIAPANQGEAPEPAVPPLTYDPESMGPVVEVDSAPRQWEAYDGWLMPRRVPVKGIYLTAYSASHEEKLKPLIDLVDSTELNAMVLNVKDDWGNLTFAADLPIAKEAGAVHAELGDVKALTRRLHEKGIYAIARVVTFKDAWVPKARPNLAVANASGGIWKDYNGVTWLNPYSREAWDYIVSVAREAALAGFDEVQFDYVRFPTDGDLSAIRYPGQDGRSREQVIGDFLAYARQELRPYGIWVSADVFGMVTSVPDDQGIGQQLEAVSTGVDFLSPMVYPSHYERGNLGVANPNAMPYETVNRSMLDVKERWEKAGLTGKVTMRPWLQDFSWGHPYGPKEVRAQIQATYDAGFDQWLLWNAANEYTEEALLPEKGS